MAIGILYIGSMFWLIWFSDRFDVRNENGKLLPVNALMKMIFYAMGLFMAFQSSILALGLGLDTNPALGNSVIKPLEVNYQVSLWFYIVAAGLLLIGTFWNLIAELYLNLINKLRVRR